MSPHPNEALGLQHSHPLREQSWQVGMSTYVLFETCALLHSAGVCPVVPSVMILRNIKLVVVIAYIVTVAVGAVVSGVTSGAGLIVFAAVALLPSAALLMLWKDPSQTMSETIQAARR